MPGVDAPTVDETRLLTALAPRALRPSGACGPALLRALEALDYYLLLVIVLYYVYYHYSTTTTTTTTVTTNYYYY